MIHPEENRLTLFNHSHKHILLVPGHFTQVVWKDCQLIGAGMSLQEAGNGMYMYVANYQPAGNVVNYFDKMQKVNACLQPRAGARLMSVWTDIYGNLINATQQFKHATQQQHSSQGGAATWRDNFLKNILNFLNSFSFSLFHFSFAAAMD
ncbi:hypothetical protein BsWGS_23645 [Bradybaena similaris]